MTTTTTLKETLRADLTAAIKSGDKVKAGTIRMALSAITTEEVAGKAARQLSDAEVVAVLTREQKKRREAAEAFQNAGRDEQAQLERAEGEILAGYLPQQLTDAELAELVTAAVAESGATGPREMGLVMKVLTPKIAGRAEGGRVAAAVKGALN
ncbi:MAG TPA: GatB/YqeY domain-containing protein [Actinocrinis sp.]|nr:GatB/YqeY domain-containing protein [Actinocrinis sp.]